MVPTNNMFVVTLRHYGNSNKLHAHYVYLFITNKDCDIDSNLFRYCFVFDKEFLVVMVKLSDHR